MDPVAHPGKILKRLLTGRAPLAQRRETYVHAASLLQQQLHVLCCLVEKIARIGHRMPEDGL